MVIFLPKMVLKILQSLAKIWFTVNSSRDTLKDLIGTTLDFEVTKIRLMMSYTVFPRSKDRYSFIVCKSVNW